MLMYYVGTIPFSPTDIRHYGKKGMKWHNHVYAYDKPVIVRQVSSRGTYQHTFQNGQVQIDARSGTATPIQANGSPPSQTSDKDKKKKKKRTNRKKAQGLIAQNYATSYASIIRK